MAGTNKIRFGFAAAPVGVKGTGDAELYKEAVKTCELGHSLGYEAAWFLEHHFTDYYPCPSPTVLMAHVAAHCPALNLGTMVLVAPWHHPLRLAGELAMLSNLTQGELHIGLGRGTAPLEYDAFDLDMEEARTRFREVFEIVELALKGDRFTYEGKFVSVPREIQLRPRVDRSRISFYGAIGSPQSAEIMAGLGLPPLSIANFPLRLQRDIMNKWTERAAEQGVKTETRKPLSISCFVDETDEKARSLAKKYLPEFYQLQAEHYEVDRDAWRGISCYEQFSKMFANLKKLSQPESMDAWLDLQFIGSPETIIERLEEYSDIGFNTFIANTSTPRVPLEVQREHLRRFASEIGVRFSDRFNAELGVSV